MTDEKEQPEPCEFCESTAEYPTQMTPCGTRRYVRCSSCGAFKREEKIEPREIHAL